jgi:hypothetical protein
MPNFFNYRIDLDPKVNVIRKEVGKPVLVSFSSPENLIVVASVQDFKTKQKLSGNTFVNQFRNTWKIHAAFPHPGIYLLVIYTARRNSASHKSNHYPSTIVYKVVVSDQDKPEMWTFPQTFIHFTEGEHALIQPLYVPLKSGTRQRFEITAGTATEIKIQIDGALQSLQRSNDRFIGDFVIGRSTITLYAKYRNSGASYDGLLTFPVQT